MSSKQGYRLISIMIAFVVCLLVIAGVSSGAEKVIRVAVGIDATSLDPPMSTNLTDKNTTSQIYDTLIFRNKEMKLEPHLATSWKIINNTTWEMELRKGIKFHNGEEFNAEAVKFSIERILDPAMKAPSFAQFTAIKGVKIIDPYKVHIETKEPYPVLPAVLAECWAVPPRYTQEKGKEFLAKNPVGTGPFEFVKWLKDERVEMKANKHYWKGAPKIDRVFFMPVPERGTRIAMLKTGEVDIVSDIPPFMVKELKSDANIQVATAGGARAYFLGIDTLRKTPLADPKVRLALNYAIDADKIIETTLNGYASRLATLLTPRQFGYDPSIKPYKYDLEKAKKLLAEAGYPNGFSIDFDTPDGRYPMDKEVAQVIAGQLTKAGIKINLHVREWGNFIAQFRTEKGDLAPMWYMGWSIPTFDADAILFALCTPGKTYGRYSTEEGAKLLTDARNTMDRDKRLSLYHKALKLIHQDSAFVPLFQLTDIYGIRKGIKWEPRTDERILLFDADKE